MRNNVPALFSVCVALFVGLLALTSHAQGQTADSIYTNGRIYTANTHSPWAQVIAVKDNKIVFVGEQADAEL